MSHLRITAISLLATVATLGSPRADAVIQNVYAAGTAANTCTPALPAFEGTIRKRPLSLQNEGNTSAFITCALFPTNYVTRADLYVNSFDAQDHIVNCTVVLGYMTNARYLTKQVISPASGNQAVITVLPADFGMSTNVQSNFISFSCQLPPGTGINDLGVGWQQDIGA